MHPSLSVLVADPLGSLLGGTSPSPSPTGTTGGSSGGTNYGSLVLIVLVVIVVYFVIIRPQRNRTRRAQQTVSELVAGVEVMTRSGLFATVVAVEDDSLLLEVAPGVHSRYHKDAVARVITPELPEADPDLDADFAAEPSADADRAAGAGLGADPPAIESIPVPESPSPGRSDDPDPGMVLDSAPPPPPAPVVPADTPEPDSSDPTDASRLRPRTEPNTEG